ncbi:MAG: aminotransferase class V-fold PLP-dependent enzyme [Lachnospiraceae bacterium]|jgi:cysteine desulfurase/selenocysteine lyase|nr:aminotransferase class V-fold PLP-dependent enzyme [Lachnospiraceae bacterium]
MKNINNGQLFEKKLLDEIREKFYYVSHDPIADKDRIFFDNAGGAFRLKAAEEAFFRTDSIPDCPEHRQEQAVWLQNVQKKGTEDIRLIFNASEKYQIATNLTASMVMFEMTRAIIENVPGTNIVTTALEHPSAYDSAKMYAEKNGKELRTAKTNSLTGGVDVAEVVKLVDKDTCCVSIIYGSNISGAIIDLEGIVSECRKIKPDLYIICDAVQHTPHDVIDLEKTPVDAINFAPYKFFGVRGMGFGLLSERAAKLPHNQLLAKEAFDWELGSPASGHFAAITAVVDYVCWIGSKFTDSTDRRTLYTEGMEHIKLHERALMYHMLEGTDKAQGLRHIPGVTVFLDYPDLKKRDFIMAIGIDKLGYIEAVEEYEKNDIIVFERVATSHFSVRMLKSFGMEGAIRVSPLHCNSIDDVEQFLNITEKLAR